MEKMDTAEKSLRRARREIERGNITIRGRDPNGKPHGRARTLGRLDWRIEGGTVIPSAAATRELRASYGAQVVPMASRWHRAG
jgi:hypothetical protein